jgi:hypothetical protein
MTRSSWRGRRAQDEEIVHEKTLVRRAQGLRPSPAHHYPKAIDARTLQGHHWSPASYSSISRRSRNNPNRYGSASEEDTSSPKSCQQPRLGGPQLGRLSSDSKYLSGATYGGTLGLAPHAYDPVINEKEPHDVRTDLLRYPDGKGKPSSALPWRGFINVGVLVMLISGLLCFLTLIRNNVRSRHIQ